MLNGHVDVERAGLAAAPREQIHDGIQGGHEEHLATDARVQDNNERLRLQFQRIT